MVRVVRFRVNDPLSGFLSVQSEGIGHPDNPLWTKGLFSIKVKCRTIKSNLSRWQLDVHCKLMAEYRFSDAVFTVKFGYRLGLQSAFFFSSRRRHTRFDCDWSSDVCSSD